MSVFAQHTASLVDEIHGAIDTRRAWPRRVLHCAVLLPLPGIDIDATSARAPARADAAPHSAHCAGGDRWRWARS